MGYADEYLLNLLNEYKTMEEKQQKELNSLPAGKLVIRKEKGKMNFVHYLTEKESGAGKIRRGITKQPEMIRALARKQYLQESLSLLQKNIPALESLLKKHLEPTPDNLLKKLPKSWQQLPAGLFSEEWQEARDWAAAEFEQDKSRPEEKCHVTTGGLRVRSKSEVVIAEKLEAYQIPFRYEQVLYIENRRFSPDFTIFHRGELFYWEHCGLVGNPRYMKHHKWKLDMYERAGIVPWKNLIVTYDDETGNLDSRMIEAEIRNRLL